MRRVKIYESNWIMWGGNRIDLRVGANVEVGPRTFTAANIYPARPPD